MSRPTIYDELCEDILTNEKFLTDYEELVSSEDSDLDQSIYKRLLESASIFACSSKENDKIIALKISAKIMEIGKTPEIFSRACELIFVRLGCFPTIKMSIDEYSSKDYFNIMSGKLGDDLPIVLRMELINKIISNKISLDKKDIFLTDYQANVLRHLREKKSVSISAPTSAGKSFVLIRYIIECLKNNSKFIVVYIVPTIALISQVQRDIKKSIEDYEIDNINIITSYYEIFNENKLLQSKTLLILTQERMQSIESKIENPLRVDLLIVDEAQNIEEEARGIILEDSIQQLKDWYHDIQMVFISPFTENPEKFGSIFSCDKLKSLTTRFSPVSQNIIDVKIKKGYIEMYYISQELKRSMKLQFDKVEEKIPKTYERKAWLASKLIGSGPTMIYCNGPVDCRRTADAISEYSAISTIDPKVMDIIEFLEKNIHPNYYLIDYLKKGIGYHYGKMPPSVKTAIEILFIKKYLQAICCTSTLMEGMNLPAKNIVLYKPTVGNRNPIKELDLLNLAGRAGRLMKDFSGNIYCIDSEEWKGARLGTERLSHEIVSSMENVLSNKREMIVEQLKSIIKSRDKNKDVEAAVTSFIINEIRQGKIEPVEQMIRNDQDINNSLKEVVSMVKKIAGKMNLPADIILKNRSIDPRLQNDLYNALAKLDSPPIPKHPSSGEFYSSLSKIFPILNECLKKNGHERYNNYHALITDRWANEKPLKEIIEMRLNYLEKDKNQKLDEDIINTELENIFEILNKKIKYELSRDISCYIDIINYISKEQNENLESIDHISYYIEVGAHNPTTLVLIGNGIPRTIAILISQILPRNLNDFEKCKKIISKKNRELVKEIPSILLEEILT